MSDENKLKSELTEKKDEWLISELTSEEETSKDAGIQFDLSVPTEGEHNYTTLSSSFYSEGLTDNSQITLILHDYVIFSWLKETSIVKSMIAFHGIVFILACKLVSHISTSGI